MSLYNNVSRAIRLIRLYKGFKRNYAGVLQEYSGYTGSPEYIQREMYGKLHSTQDPLILALQKVIYPVYYQFNKAIEQKLQVDGWRFWWWLVKTIFLPDWSDPIDVAVWLVSVAAGVFSLGAGFLAGVAVRVGGVIGKLVKIVSGISKLLKTISGGKNLLAGINKFRGVWQVGSKMTFAIKASAMISGWSSGIYSTFKGISTVYTGFDLYYTDQEDVKEIKASYTEKSLKWRDKTMSSLNNRLKGIGQDLEFIQESMKKLQQDARQGLIISMGTGGFLRLLQKRFETAIKLHVKINKGEKHWIDEINKTCQKLCKFFQKSTKITNKLKVTKDGITNAVVSIDGFGSDQNVFKFDILKNSTVKNAIANIKVQKSEKGQTKVGVDVKGKKKYRITQDGDFYLDDKLVSKGLSDKQRESLGLNSMGKKYNNYYTKQGNNKFPYNIYVDGVERVSGAVTYISMRLFDNTKSKNARWGNNFYGKNGEMIFFMNGQNTDQFEYKKIQKKLLNQFLFLDLRWLYYYSPKRKIQIDFQDVEGFLWDIMHKVSKKEGDVKTKEQTFYKLLQRMDKIIQLKIDQFQQVKQKEAQ